MNAIFQIFSLKFTFSRLGELRITYADVQLAHTITELDVTVIPLRKECVDGLLQRGAHFFAVRHPTQREHVFLEEHPNRLIEVLDIINKDSPTARVTAKVLTCTVAIGH